MKQRVRELADKATKVGVRARAMAQQGKLSERVRSSGGPLATEIADALEFAAAGSRVGDPESFALIEGMRAEYAASNDSLEQVDYGAGEGTRGEILEPTVRTRRLDEFVKVSKSPELGRLLYGLVAELKPGRVLEFGTALGISGAYIQSAMVANGEGTLTTMEGAPGVAEVARETWNRCGLPAAEIIIGNFDETLVKAIDARVDLAFIDGNHRAIPTISYLHQIAPALGKPGLVVFDDITWTADMRSAWRMAQRHPDAALSIDLESMGLLVLDPHFDGEVCRLQGTLGSCAP